MQKEKEKEQVIKKIAKEEVYFKVSLYFIEEMTKQEKKFLWYLRPSTKIIHKHWRHFLDEWDEEIKK